MLDLEQEMSRCRVCPRKCGADREHGKTGYCKAPSGVAAARAGDPLAFWRDYIHLSAVADTRYSRCFSLSADGRVILRPGLTEADLPKTRHIVDGIFLVDGPAASGRRVIFDNGRKK